MEEVNDTLPPLSPMSAAFDEREIDLEAPPAQLHHPHQPVLSQLPLPQPVTRNHPPPNPHRLHPEWLSLIMGFCFLAVSTGLQCQHSSCQSTGFLTASLSLVFALAALVTSKYIDENLRATAQTLEYAGVFCGFTAFFHAITPAFPLCLKIISWTIYVVSIVAIMLSHSNFF